MGAWVGIPVGVEELPDDEPLLNLVGCSVGCEVGCSVGELEPEPLLLVGCTLQ